MSFPEGIPDLSFRWSGSDNGRDRRGHPPVAFIVAMSLDRLFLGGLLSSRACLRFTGQPEHAILALDGRDLFIERQLSEFPFVSLTGSVQSM
jgi:hypothetical protein